MTICNLPHVPLGRSDLQMRDELLSVALNAPSRLVPCTYRSDACVYTPFCLAHVFHEGSTPFLETHGQLQQNVSANIRMGLGFSWDSLLPSMLHDNRRFVLVIQIRSKIAFAKCRHWFRRGVLQEACYGPHPDVPGHIGPRIALSYITLLGHSSAAEHHSNLRCMLLRRSHVSICHG